MGDVETNKDIARKVEAAWNEGRFDDLDQYFAPDFETHSGLPGMPPNLASAKSIGPMAAQAFPDRKVEIQDIVAEGDKVYIRSRISGTNNGAGVPWLGQPEANGNKVDFESWIAYRFRDGKVVEAWGINDGMSAMMQLGSLQMGAPAGAA